MYEDAIEQLNIGFNPSSDEIMRFIENNGRMYLEDAVLKMKKQEIERILSEHPYKMYQEPDGRWSTYVRDTNYSNNRRRIVRTHKEDLVAYLYQFYLEMDERARIDKITLMELYPEWLEYKKSKTKASTTIDRIQRDWKRYYIGSAIINIPIRQLEKDMLKDWAEELIIRENLNRKQYNNLSLIMRQSLAFASEKKKYISENPFSRVSIEPNLLRPTMKKSSDSQVFLIGVEEQLKKYAKEQFDKGVHKKQPLTPLAVLFLLQTGLRVGELRALRYDDISEDGLHINVSKFIRNETGEVVDNTKGRFGSRIVILSDEAIDIIERARNYQIEHGASTSGYIFSMSDTPIGYSAINKAFYRYCDAINTCRKSTHAGRRTFISTMFDAGMAPDGIRRMVGQKDIQTTLDSYCFDRRSDIANRAIINKALSSQS